MLRALRLRAAGLGCAIVVAAAGPAAGQEADAGYEQTVDLTFPTDPRATYVDSYHDARSGGRVHRATDLMGDKGWEVYAAVGGSVCGIAGVDGDEPAYGYALVVCGDDGRDYHYLHLNNDTPGSDDGLGGTEHAYAPGVSDGARIERGQHIAWMGDSGNAEASGPHLHFMIEDPAVTDPYGSNYLNPYPSLVDAEARDDYADDGDTDVTAASQGGQPETVTAAAVDRVAGPDRVGTAVALSQAGFQTAGRVVLASAESFPDAVAAGPLAAAVDGPLLTTWRERLDGRVAQEIRRLGASRVTLVGGHLALSRQVESDLVATARVAADDIQRVAGADAPATAAAVARAVWAAGGSRRATVTLGAHPQAVGAPDALASSWHGSVTGAPVLLVAPDELPPSTADALDGVTEAVIVGGTAAVSEHVAGHVAEHAGSTRRLAGDERYGTAAAVAADLLGQGAALQRVWVTGGAAWADALAAGPAVARAGETFLLVDGAADGSDAATDAWLRERADEVDAGRVVGGRAVVGDDAARLLAERIG